MASDGRIGALAGHGLDGGPTHESRALLGDVAPVDRGVGFFVRRGQPSPAAQMPRRGEPRDVADLGHEYRGQHWSDTGNGLHGVVAEVAGEVWGALLLEHGEFAVDVSDQVAQGLDPHSVGVGQLHLVEEDLAAHTEQVAHGHPHAFFRQDGVDLGLEAGA